MKRFISLILVTASCFTLPCSGRAQKIAVFAERLFTMAGEQIIPNAVVLIEDGKIVQVGPTAAVSVPEGYLTCRARVVTPGFIDAHSQVGLSGIYNVAADRDMDENTNPNTADLRAIDGFNPEEKLIAYVLRYGVTTVQVCPGPSNPIAGQAAVFKTQGKTVEEMLVKFPSAMVFTLGEAPKAAYGGNHKAPRTRMATASIIRRALHQTAQESDKRPYSTTADQLAADPRKTALARVVNREIPALVTCHRSDDIMTALRLAREFNLRLILDGAIEGYLVRDEIKRAEVPVLVGPTMQRLGSLETINSTFENAALLSRVGIPVAFQSGSENYVPKTRLVGFEAGIAMANGLSELEALEAITLAPAKILGIADRVGSIEPGKDADIVLFDGDPFEYLTHVTRVIVNGKVAYSRGSKQ